MNATTEEPSSEAPSINPIQVIGGLIGVAAFLGFTFWGAGTLKWWPGWAYMGLLTITQTVNSVLVGIKNPELLKRRGSFGEGTPRWDRVCLGIFGGAFGLMFIVAALDASRFMWTHMPSWMLWMGVAIHVCGTSLVTWSMLANPFFEKTARLQTDREQRVIDIGPYRFVRHPGYVGTVVGFIVAAPFVLGSWWAFVPAVVSSLGLIVPTVLEDCMLRDGLEGYDDYAKRVRFRLLPGIW